MKIVGYLFATLVVIIVVTPLIAYSVAVYGIIFYKFWYWFVLPVFPGLPLITFTQAIGLNFFLILFKNSGTNSEKSKDPKDKTEVLTGNLAGPWVVLLIGYLFKIIFFS